MRTASHVRKLQSTGRMILWVGLYLFVSRSESANRLQHLRVFLYDEGITDRISASGYSLSNSQ
jgi:hypothetical protein